MAVPDRRQPLLNFKRQEWVASKSVCSFADAAVGLWRVPDFDPPDQRTVPVPVELLVEETKIGCLTRADEWRDAYEKVAANLYRDHPFYEPAEQASMLRTALASVSLDATK